MVKVRVLVWTDPVAPDELIPAVLAEVKVEPVEAINVEVAATPDNIKVLKFKDPLESTVKVEVVLATVLIAKLLNNVVVLPLLTIKLTYCDDPAVVFVIV